MSDSVNSVDPVEKKRGCPCGCGGICAVAAVFLCLFYIALGPVNPPMHRAPQNAAMQTARSINLLLFSYANDHDQKYPSGKSSTEIFQRLLDEQYANDAEIFYLSLPGKIKPVAGQKLRPENIGFDVTSGIDSGSADSVPVVFETGYKISYVAGGVAVLISANHSQSSPPARTWAKWWNNDVQKPELNPMAGIAVAYKSNSAAFLKAQTAPSGEISIPKFISPDFEANGQVYRQLTPDGVLP